MVVYCSYCRRGNRDVFVCDGCGAPLPEIRQTMEPVPQFWTLTTNYYTYTRTNDIRRYYRDDDMGYHNKRLRNG